MGSRSEGASGCALVEGEVTQDGVATERRGRAPEWESERGMLDDRDMVSVTLTLWTDVGFVTDGAMVTLASPGAGAVSPLEHPAGRGFDVPSDDCCCGLLWSTV